MVPIGSLDDMIRISLALKNLICKSQALFGSICRLIFGFVVCIPCLSSQANIVMTFLISKAVALKMSQYLGHFGLSDNE